MAYRLLPDGQIIVNMDKGYTLRRIGTFSSRLENHFIHTFISIDGLCVGSSSSDVCMYATESTQSAILELATMIGNRLKYTSSSDMNKVSLSNLISDNLDQTLAHYHPDRFFNTTQSMAHVLNSHVSSSTNDRTFLPLAFSSGDVNRSETAQQSRPISRFAPTTLATILHQINNQKLGFDFMNEGQIDVLLKFLFKHIDQSFQTSNNRKSLEMFYRLITAQSIFVLPHCSMDQQFSSAKPCLVISTMFVQPPTSDPYSFVVYQMKALPIVINNEKYMYSNIPTILAIHRDQRKFITWSETSMIESCSFSIVVSCATMPLITSLAHYPCLAELLSDEFETNNSCQVLRSTDTEPGILEIGNGLWLLYHVQNTYVCEIYSTTSNFITETIIINNETLIRVPCDKKVVCFGSQLLSDSCENQFAVISSVSPHAEHTGGVLQVPMRNVKNRLLSNFKIQSVRAYEEIIEDLASSRSFLQNYTNELGYTILSIVLFFLSFVILYLLKCLSKKVQNELDNLKEIVHHTLLH